MCLSLSMAISYPKEDFNKNDKDLKISPIILVSLEA